MATVVANAVVNRAGISFLSRLNDETGAPLADITRAHIVARDVFAPGPWDAIDALDLVVPAATQDAMFLAVRRQIERTARGLVQRHGRLDIGAAVGAFQHRSARARRRPARRCSSARRAAAPGADAGSLRCGGGSPGELAAQISLAEWLPSTLDVVDLAEELTRRSPRRVRHFALVDLLRLDWLRDRIADLPAGRPLADRGARRTPRRAARRGP